MLDAGAGFGAWRAPLRRAGAATVVGVDRSPAPGLDAVCDLKRLPFRAGAFDGVLCAQVLEHDAEPAALVRELARVTRPGGTLVLTAPHASRIHDAPHDYFRFTAYGLRAIVEGAGFDVTSCTPCGGLLSLLLHNANSFILAATAPVPLLGTVAAAAAKLTTPVAVTFERVFDRRRLFPLNYVLVAGRR